MLRAILNKSWRLHPTRHQLYSYLPPITKTIQVRRTIHAGHCWRSRDELISDVLLWTPTYGRAKAGRPARTYIQQLCEDTGCSPEDLPLIGFYGISTTVGYLMPNPVYTYILNICFRWVGFYDISTIVCYLMPNPLYTYILNIYDLVGMGFMAYQPL